MVNEIPKIKRNCRQFAKKYNRYSKIIMGISDVITGISTIVIPVFGSIFTDDSRIFIWISSGLTLIQYTLKLRQKSHKYKQISEKFEKILKNINDSEINASQLKFYKEQYNTLITTIGNKEFINEYINNDDLYEEWVLNRNYS